MMKRVQPRLLACALLCVAMLVSTVGLAAPAKRVLILNSYHAGYKGSDDLVQGISEVLRQASPALDIKVDYLDSKNYSGSAFDARTLELLRYKYQGRRFDLLISTDDYAFDLLEQHYDTIFRAVPLVFCGTNYFDRERLRGHPEFVGVDEKPSFEDTIRLIRTLHPETRRIVAIHDISETGRLNSLDFDAVARQFASEVEFSSLAGKTMEELVAAARALQPGTVAVYFASFVADRNESRISSVDALRRIAEVSRVPIYGGWEFTLGHGIVGGRLIDLHEHGRTAGRLAAQILEGASPGQLVRVAPSPNRFMFDYPQLQRFNIDLSRLPAGSEVINRPPTFFDKYGIALLSVVSVLLAIAVLLALAKMAISRRELARSRLKFETIFRTSPDAIVIAEVRTARILEVNDAFARNMGHAPADAAGRTLAELGVWKAAGEWDRLLHSLGSGTRLENYETHFCKADGDATPMLLSLETQTIDEKDVLLITARDISERKRAEQALAAREERFRLLFDGASEGILILSPSGDLVAVNESFARMHGYTAQEMRGLNLKDLDTPETFRLVPERMQRILAGERAVFEVAHYHRDGRIILFEVSSSLIVSDEDRLIQSFHRDITDRKKAEDALKLSEERMRAIVETEPECVKVVGRDGMLVEMNRAGLDMLEAASLAEAKKLCLADYLLPEFRAAFLDLHRRVMRGEIGVLAFEIQGLRGSRRWLETHAAPMRDSSGEVVALLGITRDITQSKQADAQRRALEDELRQSQKMEALGNLAGGVAHDFNNALATILGNVELARQDVGAGHAALVSLEEIGKASRRAKDLVQQILAFGRRQNLDRKWTSLSLVVIESARLIRATLPAEVTLNVTCKPDAPAVLADATQIKQVLLNLCQNALHAVQGQGRPGVIGICLVGVTQYVPSDDLRPGRYACLAVRDNGAGMDEATRSRVFEPFFTTKAKGKGTGLGLSVVHGIAQSHDARIELETAPGKGSEFRIYFPACETGVPEEAPLARSLAPLPGEGKRVLYVDDEEAIIFLMTRLLERKGYRVSGFTRPQEALEAARSDPHGFDIVVTDYNMPVLSGLEVAEALRQIRADLPVVLASGYVTEELRQRALAAGVRELIYKPDTVEDLCDAVARSVNTQGGDGTGGQRPLAGVHG